MSTNPIAFALARSLASWRFSLCDPHPDAWNYRQIDAEHALQFRS